MCTMHKLGLQVWPSPDMMVLMSTKSTLCKVAMLSIALEDTFAYCMVEEFAAGLKTHSQIVGQLASQAGRQTDADIHRQTETNDTDGDRRRQTVTDGRTGRRADRQTHSSVCLAVVCVT